MTMQSAIATSIKAASMAVLLVASGFAYAGSTIRISNNSKAPWCLRITEEPGAAVMAQGGKDAAAVELSAKADKLVYFIQPGDSCTLQFKSPQDLPAKREIGLVDQSGREEAQVTLEAKAAPSLAAGQGGVEAFAALSADCPEVILAESPDSLVINGDCWR